MSLPIDHATPRRAKFSWGTVEAGRRCTGFLQEFVFARGASATSDAILRIAGFLLRFPAHRRWTSILSGRTTARLLQQYPRIVYRHASPYLFDGARWNHRLQMLESHYAFLNRTHDARFFDRVLDNRGLVLWSRELEGRRFSIALHGPCFESHHREGDLSLALDMDGNAIFRIAFSIVSAHLVNARNPLAHSSSHSIYIGQVQGVPGRWDRVRQATTICHEVAPADLLMSALAGAAIGWEIDHIVAVGAARQLAACGPEATSVRFDYGGFWARYQARPTAEGHHFLPLPLPQKPIESIVGRHRRRTLVKRRFKDALRIDVMAAIVRHRSGRLDDPC